MWLDLHKFEILRIYSYVACVRVYVRLHDYCFCISLPGQISRDTYWYTTPTAIWEMCAVRLSRFEVGVWCVMPDAALYVAFRPCIIFVERFFFVFTRRKKGTSSADTWYCNKITDEQNVRGMWCRPPHPRLGLRFPWNKKFGGVSVEHTLLSRIKNLAWGQYIPVSYY